MCRLVVVACGMRLRTVRNGYTKKIHLVNWVFYYYCYYYYYHHRRRRILYVGHLYSYS